MVGHQDPWWFKSGEILLTNNAGSVKKIHEDVDCRNDTKIDKYITYRFMKETGIFRWKVIAITY